MPKTSDVLAKYDLRALPLTRSGECNAAQARVLREANLASLFPGACHPQAALSGLLLRLGCWEQCHQVSQDISAPEGSYWHAIAHRMEPDSSNAAYWFRQLGKHPIFPELHRGALQILNRGETEWRLKRDWDPFLFIEWCDQARAQAGSPKEQVAREIQQLEWQLLFEWCTAVE